MPYMRIDSADLPKLAEKLAAAGTRLVLPVREGSEIFYRERADAAGLDLATIPRNSVKEFLFPKCEKILRYQYKGAEVAVEDVEPAGGRRTVIFGARPCDAASLPIVEPLWNWDYKDKFFNERRAGTILVTYACRTAPNEACFCVSVGLTPAAEEGSDVLLYALEGGAVAVRFVSDAGKELEPVFAGLRKGEVEDAAVEAFRKSGVDSLAHRKKLDKVRPWLETHFEDRLWEEKAFRCLGCGTCTFVCPTCHCFDIQDESCFDAGYRLKNWDACQFSLFTLHTSGHNPRDTQPKRYRQRIYHKYAIYPEKFGKILCTGCGRCVAWCPVNLSLYDVVASAQERAEKGD
ncbi:MAG: 4Fe-4S dicluster domain-containing protein [bacterium]